MYNKHGEILEQIDLRSCGCPISGSVQGCVGWGSEGSNLVKGMAGGLAYVVLKGVFQTQTIL